MDSVFQCYIEFIPKDSLLKKYGSIKSVFDVEENPNESFMPVHLGLFREEINELWADCKLSIEKVLNVLPTLNLNAGSSFHRPKVGKAIFGYLDSNYCCVDYDVNSNYITIFQFGIDITKKQTGKFVSSILEIANKMNFLVMGSDLVLFEPKMEFLDSYFRQSPAYKFIKSEVEFLKDLKAGKQKNDVTIYSKYY